MVKINLCYFVEFWSGWGKLRVLIWRLRLICLKPVEESYDKESAFPRGGGVGVLPYMGYMGIVPL